MSKCPSCGHDGAYNSGFTVECPNEKCMHYSKEQAALWRKEMGLSDTIPAKDAKREGWSFSKQWYRKPQNTPDSQQHTIPNKKT